MLKPNSTLNAFASAIGDPLVADVIATSKQNVAAGLLGGGSHALGLVWLGGLYPDIASGAPQTFTSSATFDIDATQVADLNLHVGLQDAVLTGSGFDLLDFAILLNGLAVEQQEFTSLLSALAYFDDRVLDFGAIVPTSAGLLDVAFNFALTAHRRGDGFAIDVAFAAVPEPPILAMLFVGLVLLIVSRRLAARVSADEVNTSTRRNRKLTRCLNANGLPQTCSSKRPSRPSSLSTSRATQPADGARRRAKRIKSLR